MNPAVSLAMVTAFNVVLVLMAGRMIRNAHQRYGQPLQYVGRVDWEARLEWSTSLLIVAILVSSLTRTYYLGTSSIHSIPTYIVVADACRALFALIFYGAWRVYKDRR